MILIIITNTDRLPASLPNDLTSNWSAVIHPGRKMSQWPIGHQHLCLQSVIMIWQKILTLLICQIGRIIGRMGQWDQGLEAEGIVNYEDGCKLEESDDDGKNNIDMSDVKVM